MLKNRVGSIPLTKETVIDKKPWRSNTVPHVRGEKKKKPQQTPEEINRDFKYYFTLKNDCTNAKKITNAELAQINYFKSNKCKSHETTSLLTFTFNLLTANYGDELL